MSDEPDIVVRDGLLYRVVADTGAYDGTRCINMAMHYGHVHPGVEIHEQHHHHDERCTRRQLILEPVGTIALPSEILVRWREQRVAGEQPEYQYRTVPESTSTTTEEHHVHEHDHDHQPADQRRHGAPHD